MGDGMAPTDDRPPEERPPPFKGWEWRRCGARVEDDTWDGWWRRGVKTWLVTGPGQHNPRFQKSWEGATWCAPATEDLQQMAWPDMLTYTWVLREEFYGHCAAGGSWEELGVDKQWRPLEVWRSAEFGRLRPVDENGRPCMLRRVKRRD